VSIRTLRDGEVVFIVTVRPEGFVAGPSISNMIISRFRLISLVLFTAILLAVLVSYSGSQAT